MTNVDEEMKRLISTYGINDVLAALCRHANSNGLERLFTKLNRVYEWLIK